MHRVSRDFYWPDMKHQVKQYINECNICQQTKHKNVAPTGFLQPLPIPNRNFSHITMDLIEGLPLFQGYSVIYVVVDCLSKYAHFITLTHPYTASKVAMALCHVSLNSMDYPNPLSQTGTQFHKQFLEKAFQSLKNYTILQHSIPPSN